MKNYIQISGKRIQLTAEQVTQLMGQDNPPASPGILLSEIEEGDTFKFGEWEFVVLDHVSEYNTAVICKGLLPDTTVFGDNNNYNGSAVDGICNKFAESLAAIVGADNIVEHEVDLTSDDGLKDYGVISRKVSCLTAERYRWYVHILDKHKVKAWWWLATACSTAAHDWDTAAKCVSPSGCICGGNLFNYHFRGVRPFCILKSNIFVSK